MTLTYLVSLLLLVAIVTSQEEDSYSNTPSKFLQVPNYELPQISLSLQLPRAEDPIPFDTYELGKDLSAPSDLTVPHANFYQVPVPSQDLQVPTQQWNPDNDPVYLYELPAEITKQTSPTNLHPKKYDKVVFEKLKPLSSKPKEEIVLVPVKVEDYISKEKQKQKTVLNLLKAKNQRQVQVEKVKENDPIVAASDHAAFNSLASNHPVANPGQRVEFQMHGYDGPKSYKWGYDTGKGHNRHFRYEESNKDGYIKGHYGYYEKNGKLRMVNYDADPHSGFHAEESSENIF